jgi:hypothetical protein
MKHEEMKEVVKIAASKANYLKEDVDFSDELFIMVAKEYYRKYGYIPASWKQYMEDRIKTK